MKYFSLKTLKSQSGFTLIELMIVVAIISLLATLALPRFEVFQAKAKFTEATVNMKTIITLYNTSNLVGGGDLGSSTMDSGYGKTNPADPNPASNCNFPNGLGFTLTNCQKVNFTYRISSVANLIAVIFADAERIYSPCGSGVMGLQARENISQAGEVDETYYSFTMFNFRPGQSPGEVINHCN